MSDTPTSGAAAPATASLKDLKAAQPKAGADFLVKCLEDGLTVAAATTRYLEQLEASHEELKAKSKLIGTQALGGGNKADAAATAGEDFSELVKQKMAASPNMTRRDAIKAAARENPEAHAAFVSNCPKAKR